MLFAIYTKNRKYLVNSSKIFAVESVGNGKKKKGGTIRIVSANGATIDIPVTFDEFLDILQGGSEQEELEDELLDQEPQEQEDFTLIGNMLLTQEGADTGMRLHGRSMTEAPLPTKKNKKRKTQISKKCRRI